MNDSYLGKMIQAIILENHSQVLIKFKNKKKQPLNEFISLLIGAYIMKSLSWKVLN